MIIILVYYQYINYNYHSCKNLRVDNWEDNNWEKVLTAEDLR